MENYNIWRLKELAEALRKFSFTADEAIEAIEFWAEKFRPVYDAMKAAQVRAHQQQILKVKCWTLGLTFNEKRRLK